MTQNICECHCGTRIDLDEQLLEQRQMWKEKYLCLQQQVKLDIQTLKDNIYAQCSGIMQNQFSQKQSQHTRAINEKNSQIKDLITKIINLQTQNKVLSKEKELTEHKLNQFQAILNQKQQIINDLKSRGSKSIRDWELKHEEEIINLKQRLTSLSRQGIQKLESEKQILKQKLKQFQARYQKILPQIQKMRACINTKTAQNQQLLAKIQKLNKKREQQSQISDQKYKDLQKIHSTCSKQIRKLSQQNQNALRELDRCKKISRQIKVQPVYIDRPVEVPKVIEKIVQVQKIVNKYVGDPNLEKKLKVSDEQNNKLKSQINNLLGQIKQIQQNYNRVISDLQGNIKQYQKNVVLYKKQRQALAQKIGEQNKQLDLMHSYVENLRGGQKSARCNCDNQKIVVHVKQDGTYQKTVEKLPNAPATNANQRKKK